MKIDRHISRKYSQKKHNIQLSIKKIRFLFLSCFVPLLTRVVEIILYICVSVAPCCGALCYNVKMKIDMRHSFLLAFAFILFVGNAWAAAPNKTDRHGLKQGAWAKTYKNGKTMYEGEFKDNQPVGIFKRYYETGFLQSVQTYQEANRSSVVFYDADGKTVTSQGDFVGKLKTGEWKYFDKGKLVLTELYKDGKRNGIAKSYKNDTVIEEIPYVNDLLEGVRKSYLKNGKLYSTTVYHKGLMEGDYALYEGNKTPTEKGQFVHGQKAGEWTQYDAKGKTVGHCSYVNGLSSSRQAEDKENSKAFDENEKVVTEKKYKEPTELFGGTVVTK